MKLPIILGLIAALGPCANAEDLSKLALPAAAVLENTAAECRVQGPADLLLASPANADLYTTAGREFRVDKSPRVLFRPSGPFILTARIRPEFRNKWDAGDLIVYNDADHYAKFCFEQDYQGTPRIVSVVCNEYGDDCNSYPVTGDSVYFRLVGSSARDTFGLFASQDGKSWFPIRSFRLARVDNLRIGFSAQSPAGDGCKVHFSNIDVQNREVRDIWKGD